MVEQRIRLPMTPNLTEGNQENSRRKSLGSLSSSSNGEKTFPHYLQASTGSCHNYCKYGRKHASEDKARYKARRVTKKPSDGQSLVELQQEREKKLPANLDPSANSKIREPTTPKVTKREVTTTSANGKNSSSSKVLAVEKTPMGALSTKSVDRKIPLSREILAKRTKEGTLTKSLDSQIPVSSETYAENKRPRQGMKATVIKLKTSLDSKRLSSPKIMKKDVPSNFGNPKVSLKQSSSKAKKVKLAESSSTSLALRLSSRDASRVLNAWRNSATKEVQSTGTSKTALKKVQTSQQASSSPKSSFSGIAVGLASLRSPLRVASLNAKKRKGLKVVSSLKNKNKIGKADNELPNVNNANPQSTEVLEVPNGGVVGEKTLHVIKTESENNYLESDHNETVSGESSPPPSSSSKALLLPKSPISSSHNEENIEESEITMAEAEYDFVFQFDETESIEEAETLEGENKMRQHNKAGTIHSEDKDELPMILHLKRGKVVDIRSENNGPRRLKFSQGRTLEENQSLKGNARMRFRRTAADGNTDDSKPDSENVVLRHQDVQQKKDAQGLFNNIIEETASKLVETRKSKVKALVGAFETVIFLQDDKSSPNTAS